jgi:flagellar biosynthetic protein FliQ
MTIDLAVDFIRHAVMIALLVSGPMLITAVVVGVAVSLVQAVTQLQEQTLTFIPKLLLIAAVFLVTLPWATQQLIQYVVGIIETLPTLAA